MYSLLQRSCIQYELALFITLDYSSKLHAFCYVLLIFKYKFKLQYYQWNLSMCLI